MGTKLVIPAERSESRDPYTALVHGSRIAACGGFRDDNRILSQ
jgi:hypothetical protein